MVKTALYQAEEPGRPPHYVYKHGPYAGWTRAECDRVGAEQIGYRVLRNGKRIKLPRVQGEMGDWDWWWWLENNNIGVTHEHQYVDLPVSVAMHKDNREYLHRVPGVP